MSISILDAIRDENLFRPFLAENDSLATWQNWMRCLRVLYGLPLHRRHYSFIQQVTGRDPAKLPAKGFNTALFLNGRRSGKSKTAAVIGAYEAVFADTAKVSMGEQPLVCISSPTREQSRIVKGYLRAIFSTPLLAPEVVSETRNGFLLRRSNVRIEIISGDHKVVRGYTLLAAICDECAFLGDEDAKTKQDGELIRALSPALLTVGGKLIAITTPYARKGWCYTTYKKHFDNDSSNILVINCPSQVMNPTLPAEEIAQAYVDDYQGALAEYGAQFRDAVNQLVPRAVVERLVVKGRTELMPQPGIRYEAFDDMSSGVSSATADDAVLAIAHAEGRTIVIDKLARYKPPFSPYDVIRKMADELRRFGGVSRVWGDLFAPNFVGQCFNGHHIKYLKAEKNKSELYIDLLSRLSSGEIELVDDPTLVSQLCSLERRTRSGGRDIVDHPRGQHDDLANAVAGVCQVMSRPVIKVGALGGGQSYRSLSTMLNY
jgi:hypothetical protein